MDDQKDSRKSQLSTIIDGQIVRTNPFGRNKSGDRIYRRAERIVAALHLLTNHVPATEPSRREIRSEAVRLLSLILDLRDEMRASDSLQARKVQASIRSLISLVRMLCFSGFVSQQNTKTCIEALDELGNYLISLQRSSLSESISLTKEELLEDTEQRQVLKDTVSVITDSDVRETSVTTPSSQTPQTFHNGRAEKIIDFLKSKGELGIRDIASNFPEYSEKMIQRELATLVSRGRVRRTGLKRWSTYALIG